MRRSGDEDYSRLAPAPIAPGQLGDYNFDGAVNAADYVVFRKGLPTGGYDLWRERFGEPGSGGAATADAAADRFAVPEPAAITLLTLAAVAIYARRRQNA